jgi:hypothetical protein
MTKDQYHTYVPLVIDPAASPIVWRPQALLTANGEL